MKVRLRRRLSVALVLAGLCIAPVVFAQDKPAKPPVTKPVDAKVEMKVLGYQLKPMTKGELEAETARWFGAYRAKIKAISDLEILEAKGDESQADKRRDVTAESEEILTRLNEVIKAYEKKGGDAAEQNKYIGSMSLGLDAAGSLMDSKEMIKLTKDAYAWALRPDGGIKFAAKIISIILVLLFFRLLAWFISRMVRKAVGRSRNMTEMLREFLVSMSRKLVKFIGVMVALTLLGIEVGPFVAGIGAIGFIVAFALQGTLSNFAAGIMILMYRPFDTGNVVTVAGATGKVETMSLVSTTLLTPDNQIIVVPNGAIWGGLITNITGKDQRRVDLTFGIGYDDDIAKAQSILEEVVAAHPKVLKEPGTTIKVHELADSSVNFVCRPWCATADYWDVYWDLTRTVKERFDDAGVSIPFPQTDIHVHGLPTNGSSPTEAPAAPVPALSSVGAPPSPPSPFARPPTPPRPPRPPTGRLDS